MLLCSLSQSWYLSASSLAEGFVREMAVCTSAVMTGSIARRDLLGVAGRENGVGVVSGNKGCGFSQWSSVSRVLKTFLKGIMAASLHTR